jgi:hypothetical protein
MAFFFFGQDASFAASCGDAAVTTFLVVWGLGQVWQPLGVEQWVKNPLYDIKQMLLATAVVRFLAALPT